MSVDKLVTDILGERPTVKDRALRELIDARMKAGGEVKAAGGGFVRKAMKAIQKAAESADVKMTPAIKDLTTMEDAHTGLMDSVREKSGQMRKVMEGFEYKYKPGEHVFTESKSKKPLPPWKIIDRQLSGNMVMREPVPPGTPALMGKIVRDPETGKPLRTPYEPGYKVRREYAPDDWEETIIPESGILGRLDPDEPYAKGGEVYAKDGGDDWEKLKRLTPFYGAKPEPVDVEEQEAKRRLRELEGRVLERDYIEPQKDDLEGTVRRGLRSGLGKVMSPEGSKRSADILTDVASFVAPPMWGYESGQALGRAYEAGRSGDYGEAALEGGLGALGVLPAVPGIGVAARSAERAANIGSTALRRPFTPATLTVEATAPDLGQGTSYGFRQGLNDVLLQDIAAGRKAREGTGVFKSEITKRLETNPMLAVDIPRAGRIGEMAGSNEALRREIAQAGVDLNQEAMAAHRFIPLLTNRPEDASAMLIKTKGGLTGDEIVQLASRLGNEMVVTHNPRLGGVVIYPFGPVGKGGAPEFGVAKKAAQEILGKKGKIQYGVADYDRDRLFMEQVEGDYQRAGAKETSAEKAERRRKLQGLEKFMFPESTSGIPGNVKASPLGGLQPWSRGREYPTHVQGIGTKPDWRAVNYATEEVGQRRPTYAEAEKDREALLERWHRTLPGKVR